MMPTETILTETMRTRMMRSVAIRLTVVIAALGVPASTSALGDIFDLDADVPRAGSLAPAQAVPDAPAVIAPAPERSIPASSIPTPSGSASAAVAAPERPPVATERPSSANPLWEIPLTKLSDTRERPIFSPSRRPPPPATAAAVVQKAPPPKPPVKIARPQLSLVGTISSDHQGFAIFVDPSNKAALRLRIGEDYQGWKLRSIEGRDATLERDQQTAVLSLAPPAVAAPAQLPVQASNVVIAAPVDMVPRGVPRH
jgi:general secretion pathway protein N